MDRDRLAESRSRNERVGIGLISMAMGRGRVPRLATTIPVIAAELAWSTGVREAFCTPCGEGRSPRSLLAVADGSVPATILNGLVTDETTLTAAGPAGCRGKQV